MMTGIERARLDLARWEAIVAEDQAALSTAEQHVAAIRDRLAQSERTAKNLRGTVQRWDALYATREPSKTT